VTGGVTQMEMVAEVFMDGIYGCWHPMKRVVTVRVWLSPGGDGAAGWWRGRRCDHVHAWRWVVQ